MAVKQTGQTSFIEAWLPKGAGANVALDRLSGLVKWYRFEKLMAHLRDEGSPGRPGYSVLVLFRALLLQSLYGLSERELEEALGDRLSFKRFVGLSLEDAAPDHTVLNRFRNQLVEQGLLEKLFAELDRQLENAGGDLDPGGIRASEGGRAVERPRRPVCQAAGKKWLALRLKGSRGCRRRTRPDRVGADHARQCQRHHAGR